MIGRWVAFCHVMQFNGVKGKSDYLSILLQHVEKKWEVDFRNIFGFKNNHHVMISSPITVKFFCKRVTNTLRLVSSYKIALSMN